MARLYSSRPPCYQTVHHPRNHPTRTRRGARKERGKWGYRRGLHSCKDNREDLHHSAQNGQSRWAGFISSKQATEYRRAMREHLSYHAVLAGYECLAADAADQGANKLSTLLSTPWQILDWEVLSEDDEEEEACLVRRPEYRAQSRRVSSESAISWAH